MVNQRKWTKATSKLRHGGLFLVLLSGLLLISCGESEHSQIPKMNPGELPPVRAVVWDVTANEFIDRERFIGSISARELVSIRSEIQGTIESVHFQEGQKVEKGDLLIRLDDTKLQAQLAQVEADLAQLKLDYQMDSKLFEQATISRQVFDQSKAKLTRARATHQLRSRELQDTEIRAPFAGVLGSRDVSVGQVISPQLDLTYLVKLNPIDIEFRIPERFVSKVRIGQNIVVSARAWPGEQFSGKVHFIASYVDPRTRTVQVKAEILNADSRLKPGMFCEAFLEMERVENAILIPETAIFRVLNSREASVYSISSDNNIEMTTVEVGRRMAGIVQIISGLSIGDKVIVEGTQKAIPGAPLMPAPPESLDPYKKLFTDLKSQPGQGE